MFPLKSTSSVFTYSFVIGLILFCCAALVSSCGGGSGVPGRAVEIELIDSNAAPEDPRVLRILARQIGDTRTARYIAIVPLGEERSVGKAIQLFRNGRLVFAQFQRFVRAIEIGNSFVENGEFPEIVRGEPTDEHTESTVEDEGLPFLPHLSREFVRINVKTTTGPSNVSGYHVNVNLDEEFVVRVYKDCNFCSLFSEIDAVNRAQRYLELLQGWSK